MQGRKHLQGVEETQAIRQVVDVGPQYKIEVAGGGLQDGTKDKEQGNPPAMSIDEKPGADPGSRGDFGRCFEQGAFLRQ